MRCLNAQVCRLVVLFFSLSFYFSNVIANVLETQETPSVQLHWLDPTGQTLEVPWQTQGFWEWKPKNGGWAPFYRLRVTLPPDFSYRVAPESAGNLPETNPKFIDLVLTSPLASFPLSHFIPPLQAVKGGVAVRVWSEKTILIIHPSCGEKTLPLVKEIHKEGFFFLGISCLEESGKWRAVISPSDDAVWNEEESLLALTERVSSLLNSSSRPLAANARGGRPFSNAKAKESLGINGSVSAGEIFGESPTAEIHEFNFFARLGATYPILANILSTEAKVLAGIGSLVTASSTLLQSDVSLNFRIWDFSNGAHIKVRPALQYFLFKNSEVWEQAVTSIGPSLGLSLNARLPWERVETLSFFQTYFTIAPLNSSLDQIAFRRIQWDVGIQIPLFLRDDKTPWNAVFSLSHYPDSNPSTLELTYVSLGIATSL